jgi:hypothetical protein
MKTHRDCTFVEVGPNEALYRIQAIMKLRNDKRYRAGLLQALVSLEIITQKHWIELMNIYCKPEKKRKS